tara:strand:- start:198 stop:356 length:159 start_codon:yes stop_codon:yes gene_type:complete
MNSEWCLGFHFFLVHFAFFAKWTKSIPPYYDVHFFSIPNQYFEEIDLGQFSV